jgi:cytochrome c
MIIRIALLALIIMVQFHSPVLADGDVANGEKASKKCVACHQFVKAENRVGPHLVGLIGRPVASVNGFKYSESMTKHATTVPVWDEVALNAYLDNPRGVVPGTKMAFGGLKKEQERADLIAYLKSIAK